VARRRLVPSFTVLTAVERTVMLFMAVAFVNVLAVKLNM